MDYHFSLDKTKNNYRPLMNDEYCIALIEEGAMVNSKGKELKYLSPVDCYYNSGTKSLHLLDSGEVIKPLFNIYFLTNRSVVDIHHKNKILIKAMYRTNKKKE